MSIYVTICFEMRGGRECDRVLAYLQGHPRDVWDYEERVRAAFHVNFRAHWTDADVVETEVHRLRLSDASLIVYNVTLRAGASDPSLLVDQLRRCGGVQEGVLAGPWRVHAWYRREGAATWTADAGNDGRLRRRVVRVRVLLGRMREVM